MLSRPKAGVGSTVPAGIWQPPFTKKACSIDDTFSAPTNSTVISRFQGYLKDRKGHFPWAQMLEPKEMRFVYDLVAWAEAKPGFMPSPAQGRWGIQILKKLEAAEKQWKKANGGRGQRSKKLSTREDLVARRRAKVYLKSSGITFDKSSPSNVELAQGLHSISAIHELPSRSNAKMLLVRWSNENPSLG
jgi:hypothetical protein